MINQKSQKINIRNVNEIFENVINSIDASKNQILDIVDDARKEHEKLKAELQNLSGKIDLAIKEVDLLEIKDKLARNKLAQVSKNFKTNSEADIRAAYDKASEIRVEHVLAENREKSIREKRTRVELALMAAVKNIKNADQVVNQVAIAASYLKGEIMDAIEDAKFGTDMLMGVRILEAQENERTRISRDIHDGPAQMVANIVMKADLCEKIAKKNLEAGLVELSGLKVAARGALKEVRDIIYNLRPMALDDLGLNKTIEMNAKAIFEDTGIIVEYNLLKMNSQVESIIQVAIFRIIQEILNNIKKHTEATKVFVNIEYGTKYLRITIGDNGEGFNYQETISRVKKEKKNYGLIGMIERVEQLQGEIEIESDSTLGTIFNIKLPINRGVILDE